MLSLSDSDLQKQLSRLSREDQQKTIALLKRRMDTRDTTKARQRLEAATRGQLSEDGVRRLVEHYWPDAVLDGWQTRLILAVLSGAESEVSQVAIKGCTKAGKGYSVALAACLWFQLDRPTKIVVTSASHKHAHEVMFGEILRQMKRMDNRAETDIGVRRVWTSEEKYIVTASPESGEGFCHDDQTDVLTRRGWVPFAELTMEDECLTMDPETRVSEYRSPTAICRQRYKGPMYRYRAKGADFCVTPGHLMFAESARSNSEGNDCFSLRSIETLRRSHMLRDVSWDGVSSDWFVLPQLVTFERGRKYKWPSRRIPMKAWMRFLGWYFSDGNLQFQRGRASGVCVTQGKEQTIHEVRSVFRELGFDFNETERVRDGLKSVSFVITNRQLADHLSQFGCPKKNRRVPQYVRESSRLMIREFVSAFCKGDGFRLTGKRWIVYGSYKGLMDDVHELALKCGYRASMSVRETAGEQTVIRGRTVTTNRDKYVLGISPGGARIKYMPNKSEVIEYDGLVYCATVPPHHLLFTRRNGQTLWSGNSGQHGPATLFIFDEASRGSEEYWDLAQTQAACSVALSNPRTMSGWFRRLYPSGAEDSEQVIDVPGSGKRVLFTVGGMDCVNVRTGRKVIADQIDRARYDAIMAHPNATWRRVFGEGKFPEQDEELQVIAYSWLERHHRAHRPDIPVEAFALDVAASIDGDRSVLAAGSDGGCAWVREKQTADTMQVVAWVLRQALDAGIELTSGAVPVVVDMDGVGVGVGNRLAEQGVWVVEHRGNEASSVDSKTYANRRAETYGELGLRLNPKGPYPDEPWALPISTELDEDLTAPERVYKSDGIKWGLTPKDKPTPSYKGATIRETLGRSPDVGDAVAMLYRAVRERRTKQGTAGRRSFAWCGQDEDETGEVELTPFLQAIVDAGKQENER